MLLRGNGCHYLLPITWNNFVDWKALVTSLDCLFCVGLLSCRVAVDFFHENCFLFKGRNDVMISQTWEFLILVYLCPFVRNCVIKLAFVASVLTTVFTIKVWCQFHLHSSYHSFKWNWTTFANGLSQMGR